MRIVNLIENTCGREDCEAAHGLSFYIETPRHRLLMDAGPSALTVQNADALGVDLTRVDTVIISHGHYDHSDGLPAFLERNTSAKVYIRREAGEDYQSTLDGLHYIGMDPAIMSSGRVTWVDGSMRIDEELSLFGGITGRRCWPEGNRALKVRRDGICVQDSFRHEQCLVIEAEGRSVLLSGCAHSGILNILDRYREIYGNAPDIVISGFHMMKRGDYTEAERRAIDDTARELVNWPTTFYTCHCTGLPAYARMKAVMGDQLQYIRCGDSFFTGFTNKD